MPSERVLICGAGVAGSILAFWLAKHNFQVVVVERSKAEQKARQEIEIEEPALKVVKLMGILDQLNERKPVKLQNWSQHRVVLLGDAAWAPSPFTGQGIQLAIIGAWILAQELSRNRGPVALENYEKRLCSYVEKGQSIPLGGYAPYIFNPQTAWGIWLLRAIFRLVSWMVRVVSWTKLARMLPDQQHDDFDLDIEAIEAEVAR
ncbi:MAG: hypothetical protein Q9163_000196 [Psora crenata]